MKFSLLQTLSLHVLVITDCTVLCNICGTCVRACVRVFQVRDVLCGVLSCDEVQFQSLDGLKLPEGVSSSSHGLFGDYVDEAANLSPTFSDPGNERMPGLSNAPLNDNDKDGLFAASGSGADGQSLSSKQGAEEDPGLS